VKIVLVYLGKKLPKYTKTNIKTLSSKFPNENFVLLIDHANSYTFDSENNVEVIQVSDPSLSWLPQNNFLNNHKQLQNDFWYKTLARFKLIRDYMQIRDQSILHIESDILLNRDFPFDKIHSIQENYAFPMINQQQGIASLLYLKNYCAAENLLKFTESCLMENPKSTDMDILGMLFRAARKDVFVLPTIDSGSLLSANFTEDINYYLKQNFNLFNGVFDGATLGQFFFGLDRIHTNGFLKTRLYLAHHHVDPRGFRLLIENDKYYAAFSNFKIEIFNFHIHSKVNKFFLLNEKYINLFIKKKTRKYSNFSFNAFYRSKIYILKYQFKKLKYFKI
jgi:hypothetical protein